jgi:SAM-dependent methyltransferase
VVAVDLQPKMLATLRRRAARAGLADRVETREARADSLGVADLAGKVDLALLLLMVHEVSDAGRLFAEVRATLAPGGRVLVVEPRGHVKDEDFEASLAEAGRTGLRRAPGPEVWRSHTAVLEAREASSVDADPAVLPPTTP